MVIPVAKTNAMHIHKKVRVSVTTESEIAALHLKHKCVDCGRAFPTAKGLAIHRTQWWDGGSTVRSRKGTLADKAVQKAKRKAKEVELDHVMLESHQIENVYSFEYLACRLQCDGDDWADVQHWIGIAQSVFSTLSHM